MRRREKVLLKRQKMVTPQGTLVLVQQTVHRVILPMIGLCTQFLLCDTSCQGLNKAISEHSENYTNKAELESKHAINCGSSFKMMTASSNGCS